MKAGSLFTGIGGFDLAFRNAGINTVWQAEIDKNCLQLLEQRFPNARRYTDVKDIGRDAADIICGGFPCQDLSVAGKRAGLAGERSGLWFEFHRIIEVNQPRWVVIENVPGLLSSNEGRDMGILLGGLAQLGYGWAYRVLDAQYFGLAQRRRRVFIVGCLGDPRRAAQVLFERESGERDTPPSRETGERVAADVATGFGESGQGYWGEGIKPLRAEGENRPSRPSNLVAFRTNQTNAQGPIHSFGVTDSLAQDHPPAVAFQQNTRDEVRLMNGDGQIAGALAAEPGMKQQNYIAFNADRDGASSFDDLAPTLTHNGDAHSGFRDSGGLVAYGLNSKNNRYDAESQTLLPVVSSDRIDRWVDEPDRVRAIQSDGHSSTAQEHVYFKPNAVVNSLEHARPHKVISTGVRRLTPLECERLQGFPDDWTAGFSDSTRYRMLGNAVAVPVVEWIARRIQAVTL